VAFAADCHHLPARCALWTNVLSRSRSHATLIGREHWRQPSPRHQAAPMHTTSPMARTVFADARVYTRLPATMQSFLRAPQTRINLGRVHSMRRYLPCGSG